MTPEEVGTGTHRLRAGQPEWEVLGFEGSNVCRRRFRDQLYDHEDELLRLVQSETDESRGDLPG